MTMSSYNLYCQCFLFLSAFFCLCNARGETHVVGDDGWTEFSNYTLWAQGKRFHLGDSLVFRYVENLHTVVQVNTTGYEDCIKEPNLGVFRSGNDSIRLAEAGQFWFICGVGDHCENGQKLCVEVHPQIW